MSRIAEIACRVQPVDPRSGLWRYYSPRQVVDQGGVAVAGQGTVEDRLHDRCLVVVVVQLCLPLARAALLGL